MREAVFVNPLLQGLSVFAGDWHIGLLPQKMCYVKYKIELFCVIL
ncbi:hypothetical protein LCGC14_0935720 [marine sediment metagenome]|uniref:Uncharacterized protein n=1 Tax=marine sediment metagenome TaxID=412755 RepID=A0A0F9NLQ1_9ZZZZ